MSRQTSIRASSKHEFPSNPRSARRPVRTVQGKRTGKFFSPETAPTAEEVGILKRERHNLIQEKSLLKAKIKRLVDITHRPETFTSHPSTDPNSLEREYKQVEQLSAAKRAEIAQFNTSDLAAIINELQEECLMLHMELARVVAEKKNTDSELREVTKQLQEAKAQFHPDLEKKQKKIIRELERQITEQKLRNGKIRQKLDDKENEILTHKQDEAHLIILKTIEDLENKIRDEQNAIDKSKDDMRMLDESSKQEINELRLQLSQI